jgi:acyl carrier protein
MKERVRADLGGFVIDTFLFGDASGLPGDDDSLITGGVIDSTGVLELIEFLESHFAIEVTEDETVPANLDSIGRLVDYVLRKKSLAPESVGILTR